MSRPTSWNLRETPSLSEAWMKKFDIGTREQSDCMAGPGKKRLVEILPKWRIRTALRLKRLNRFCLKKVNGQVRCAGSPRLAGKCSLPAGGLSCATRKVKRVPYW